MQELEKKRKQFQSETDQLEVHHQRRHHTHINEPSATADLISDDKTESKSTLHKSTLSHKITGDYGIVVGDEKLASQNHDDHFSIMMGGREDKNGESRSLQAYANNPAPPPFNGRDDDNFRSQIGLSSGAQLSNALGVADDFASFLEFVKGMLHICGLHIYLWGRLFVEVDL